ncbi:hypothetical protein GXW82_06695 [Streptacidiphilus sp. 4-A2]|nr:hypothetical protein [Streptacidiphilus sp. 4-A2]
MLELTGQLRADSRLRAAMRLAVDSPGIAAALSADISMDVKQGFADVVRRAQQEG